MANGMQLLTGHQAVNHISAADEAGLNTALITGDNVVIANEREITCEADLTGTLTVGAFVALFSGRKVACAGATGTYTQPSAGMYRRVSVGILYSKSTQDDDVEDCDLAVYTSAAESASQSTAAGYDTGKPSVTVIGSETTEAYFELFDLVVSTTEIVTKTPVYSVFAGEKNEHARVDDLVERIETAENDIDGLDTRVSNNHSDILDIDSRLYSAENKLNGLFVDLGAPSSIGDNSISFSVPYPCPYKIIFISLNISESHTYPIVLTNLRYTAELNRNHIHNGISGGSFSADASTDSYLGYDGQYHFSVITQINDSLSQYFPISNTSRAYGVII